MARHVYYHHISKSVFDFSIFGQKPLSWPGTFGGLQGTSPFFTYPFLFFFFSFSCLFYSFSILFLSCLVYSPPPSLHLERIRHEMRSVSYEHERVLNRAMYSSLALG